MTFEKQLDALRGSSALIASDHMSALRVQGSDAFEAMQKLVPAELYLQDGQLAHTLLLDDDAVPVADVYVGMDDDAFLVVAEGLTAQEIASFAEAHVPSSRDVSFAPLHGRRVISLHGPFAWEVAAELLDPDVMGLPYLTFCHFDATTCLRAGKTGEYGFDLLLPESEFEPFKQRAFDIAGAYDLREVGLDVLDHCALENGFFNIRREGTRSLSPLELQLQWRVSYKKEFVGSRALREKKARGVGSRLTGIVCENDLVQGHVLLDEGTRVGEIANGGYSRMRRAFVGLALLDLPWAHSGLSGLETENGAPVRTTSLPFVDNLSLVVSPQRHCYARRHEIEGFPWSR